MRHFPAHNKIHLRLFLCASAHTAPICTSCSVIFGHGRSLMRNEFHAGKNAMNLESRRFGHRYYDSGGNREEHDSHLFGITVENLKKYTLKLFGQGEEKKAEVQGPAAAENQQQAVFLLSADDEELARMDAHRLRRTFNRKHDQYAKFLGGQFVSAWRAQMRRRKDEEPDEQQPPMINAEPLTVSAYYTFFDQFVGKFNEVYAGSGYTVVKVLSDKVILWLYSLRVLLECVLVYLFYRWRPRSKMLAAHRAILAQPAISFGQFVQEYLGAGKVHSLIHFPYENKAIVVLNTETVFGRREFTGKGIPIQLDDKFRSDPTLFTTRVRAVETELGTYPRKAIPIALQVETPIKRLIFYAIGCILLIMAVRKLFAKLLKHLQYRIVPIKKGGGERGAK